MLTFKDEDRAMFLLMGEGDETMYGVELGMDIDRLATTKGKAATFVYRGV